MTYLRTLAACPLMAVASWLALWQAAATVAAEAVAGITPERKDHA